MKTFNDFQTEDLQERLSPYELKLINQMYDKKGNQTAFGKAVMNFKKGDDKKAILKKLNSIKEEHEDDFQLDEVASILTRLKMARAARKSKAKRIIGAKRARKKIKIDKKTLMKRAQKRARSILSKRRLKGAKLSDLGAGQKVALSKYLAKKTAKINKMSKKLIKVVRQDELAKKRGKKKDPQQKIKANKSGIPTKK
tara:strand:+ start:230 stop:820 length:591 start_codon:yes stop_codon:yes gene_type:complete